MTSILTQSFRGLNHLGATESEDYNLVQQRRFLIYMAVLMSGGGILWGSLCLFFGFNQAAVIPFGYVILSILNLAYLDVFKQFHIVRSIQVSLSLLLPVIFQLLLGGFVYSGAVMLWSMLALGGSLAFSEIKLSLIWLVLFVMSTLFCGYFDEMARLTINLPLNLQNSTLFFVINISVITSIFFTLIILLINAYRKTQAELELSNKRVRELANNLERQVQSRTNDLQSSLAKTQAIVSNLADGLVAVDSSLNITAINPSLLSLFSIEQYGMSDVDLMLGQGLKNSFEYSWLPKELQSLLEQSIKYESTIHQEFKLAQGQRILATASPIVKQISRQNSILTGSVILARDISSEKKLEEVQKQLEVSERMSALGTLAAGIAHEINNPLTYVISNLELILEDLQNSAVGELDYDELAELGQDALEGAQRVSKVVQELRGFMKARKLELAPISLILVLQSALKLVQHQVKHHAQIKINVQDHLPQAYVDERQLVQVLVNLIVNASQAFKEQDLSKNRIQIRLSSVQIDDESTQQTKEYLQVEVRDNASGMSPEVAKRIFDPFFTTKTSVGTGLGLSICHRIIQDNGGTIRLDTQLGQGTCFTLLLPSARQHKKEKTSFLAQTTQATIKKEKDELNILKDVVVIDDEPAVGLVVSRILGRHKVRFFTQPQKALVAIKEQIPQLIISDVMMPEMNGIELYQELKKIGLSQRVFLITGGATIDSLNQFITDEKLTVLYKPFSPSELRKQVMHVLTRLEDKK